MQAGRHAEAVEAYATALPLQLAHAAATLPPPPPAPPAAAAAAASAAPSALHASPRGRIIFYCRLRAHAAADTLRSDVWGPTTLARHGVGGSEEAVICVTRELARHGWEGIIYANPPEEDREMPKRYYRSVEGPSGGRLDDGRLDGGSVTWRRWYELPAREGSGAAVDVLVSWRNAEGATLLPGARSRYV